MVNPRLSYFDFPFSREAFCNSRGPTSRPYAHAGVHFRCYGRNIRELTFVGADRGADVSQILELEIKAGAKLKSVNFVHLSNASVPLRTGPREFFAARDFDTHFAARSGKTRATFRRMVRGISVVNARTMNREAVAKGVHHVFNEWVRWASGRHFMVFKGHYREWLRAWAQDKQRGFLFMLHNESNEPVGLFGGEVDSETGEAQITIAKHLPALDGKALWILGLRQLQSEYGPRMVHCGSTADKLKSDLGFTSLPSWVVDCKKLRESIL